MAQDSTNGMLRVHCPEEVLASIPWYVDGGLTTRERGAVEAHAAICAECRAELDIVAGRPWAFDDVALPDAERVFREIAARIESERAGESNNVIPIARGRALSSGELARLEQWVLDPESLLESEFESESEDARDGAGENAQASSTAPMTPARRTFARVPRAIRPVLAAAAALALFFAGGLVGRISSSVEDAGSMAAAPGLESSDYHLASSAPAAPAIDAGPKLAVVFADSATAREISQALRSLGVEIVSGPSNLGVYHLRVLPEAVEQRAPTAADAAAIAARLAAEDGAVAIFAEPVP